LERVWFDYCSVHVSTVISHLSQQFCFLIFFIVTQWVVSVQWNYFYKLEYLSLMVVQEWITSSTSRSFILLRLFRCLHPERQMLYDQQERRCPIRNHVDKYVITKHYYQLMPLSLATYSKKTRKL
ncbi:hypothetical protein T03_3903, partial [Trichinella britovi]